MKDVTKTKLFQICLVLVITIVVSETFLFFNQEAYARDSALNAEYDSNLYQTTVQQSLPIPEPRSEATVSAVPVSKTTYSRYLPTVSATKIKKGTVKAQKAISEEKERLAREEEERKAKEAEEALKKAAGVPDANSMTLVGQFKLTAYCPCVACTGGGTGITATGTRATVGRTIAADPSVLPYGTRIYVEGYGTYTVEDTGYLGPNTLDVFFASHEACLIFGVQYANVYIIG